MKSVVVVPTYQERDTIAALLGALEIHAPDADVLVVDDSSPDGTADVVRADPRFGHQVHVLSRREKTGLGAAYRAGFAWALHRDYDRIVQMDADLSHPPARLAELLAALEDADVAVGSRYVRGGRCRGWSWRRRILSRGGNVYVRLVLGLRTHDATAGFKAFRADALRDLEVLASTSTGYCFQIENAWRAERRGLRVREVPITFTDRTAGASKMSGDIASEAVRRVAAWRLEELRARREHRRALTAHAA